MSTVTLRDEYVTREAILALLSDDEVGRVSQREGGPALAWGEEYVDLEHPDQGVLTMEEATQIQMGDVLPHSAVADATWSKLTERLAAGNES